MRRYLLTMSLIGVFGLAKLSLGDPSTGGGAHGVKQEQKEKDKTETTSKKARNSGVGHGVKSKKSSKENQPAK